MELCSQPSQQARRQVCTSFAKVGLVASGANTAPEERRVRLRAAGQLQKLLNHLRVCTQFLP